MRGFGGEAIFTSESCRTGTDRVVEASRLLYEGEGDNIDNIDIVVNVQGDEPHINPDHIDALVDGLRERIFHAASASTAHTCNIPMATLAVPLLDKRHALSKHTVKCVVDMHSDALYFSRALIPSSLSGPNVFILDPLRPTKYLRHVGVYAFERSFLLETIPGLMMSRSSTANASHNSLGHLEDIENLEQLRVLEAGHKIHVVVVDENGSRALRGGIDTPEDLQRFRELLEVK